MMATTAGFFNKSVSKLKNLRLPGDLCVGVDLSQPNYVHIVTLQKTLRGYRTVPSRCYSMQVSEPDSKEVIDFLNNTVHMAVVLPPLAVHYVLEKDGNNSSPKLAGERIPDSPDMEITRSSINEKTDLIALCKSNQTVDLPSVLPENRIQRVSALIALSKLVEYYPLVNGEISAPASEGIWKLTGSEQNCTLELAEHSNPSVRVSDKYGVPLEQLYNLPIAKPMLAAYGAALTILQPGLPELGVWGNQIEGMPEPFWVKHLAFRGILFVGILTLLLYGLTALAGYHYSSQQAELELQNISLSDQKRELSELRQANYVLRTQMKLLDSLATPFSYTAAQLLKFAEVLPSGLWLSKISTEREEQQWTIAGYSKEDNSVAALLNNLQSLDYVDRAELKQLLSKSEFRHSTKRENRHNGYVYFEVLIDIL